MQKIFRVGVGVLPLVFVALFSSPSFAKNYVVKELNHGPNGQPDVFLPELLRIEPGDSVTFQADDSGHDVRSLMNDIPAGAKPFSGPISKTFTVTFTVPGVYAYKCQPHLSFGMVGMIVVGKPTNIDKLDFSGLPRRAHDKLVALAAKVRSGDTGAH